MRTKRILQAILPVIAAVMMTGLAHGQAVQTVRAAGQATILNGDAAAAREEAIADAKRNAAEQVNGAFIRSETAVDNFMLSDDAVRSVVNGYVQTYELTREHRAGDVYHVEITATVLEDRAGEIRRQHLRIFAAVVRVENDGSTLPGLSGTLQRQVEQALVREDFTVYDAMNRSLRPMPTTPDALAGEYLAEVVITGNLRVEASDRQETSGYTGGRQTLHFARCWVDLRALDAATGKVIAVSTTPQQGAKAAGNTEDKAARAAAAEATRDIFDDFLPQIIHHAKGKSHEFTIIIRGIPDHAAFSDVKTALQNVRFRNSAVEDQGFESGRESTFTFDYGEKSFLLATKLDRLPHLLVRKQEWNRIECEYTP